MKMMFTWHGTEWLKVLASDSAITTAWFYVPLSFICCFPLLSHVKPAKTRTAVMMRYALWLGLFGFCVMYTISSTYNPFIYFRF